MLIALSSTPTLVSITAVLSIYPQIIQKGTASFAIPKCGILSTIWNIYKEYLGKGRLSRQSGEEGPGYPQGDTPTIHEVAAYGRGIPLRVPWPLAGVLTFCRNYASSPSGQSPPLLLPYGLSLTYLD